MRQRVPSRQNPQRRRRMLKLFDCTTFSYRVVRGTFGEEESVKG